MKNIILISPQSNLHDIKKEMVSKILNEGYKIILLIISPLESKREYEEMSGICRVLTSTEIEEMESLDRINYDAIQYCRRGQFPYELYLSRFRDEHGMIKFSYYTALNFWLSIFQDNEIDCVISTHIIHGRLDDTVVQAVSKMNGVDMYFFEDFGYNNSHCINFDGKLLPVYCKSGNTLDKISKPEMDKRFYQTEPIYKLDKNIFYQFLYDIGGNLLEDLGRRIIHWDWKAQAIRKQKSKAFWSDKFWGYVKLKQIESHLAKIAKPFNREEKYIFYALHFEPEANIEVRVILENQLTIIKMLADALPVGWKLYVKEHPSQFKVNNDGGYEYMISVSRFKSKEFYDKISNFPNTQIISTDTLSNDLILHCKAVASIVGSVFFEAISLSKPILQFSELNPVTYVKDVFNVHSYHECEEALKKIADGFVPQYDDVDEVIDKYTLKKEDLGANIVELLKVKCGVIGR